MILKKYKDWLIPIILVAVIKIFSLDKNWAENNYANGLFRFIGALLRGLFGWLPFSIGDVLYGVLIIWLIVKITKGIGILLKRKVTWKGTGINVLKGLKIGLWIYITFNLLWGINYNRKGIGYQIQLAQIRKDATTLKIIDSILVEKVNSTKLTLIKNAIAYPSNEELFIRSMAMYKNAESKYPFLHHPYTSLKKSLFGSIGNYLGYTGYYNPFTGEAQVNTTVPKFYLPFTTCHEIAHQLGYAKENEANFVAYLVANQSTDTLFQYSAYAEMLMYTHNTLYSYDSNVAKQNITKLIPEIKQEFADAAVFYKKYKNPFKPIIKKVYSLFLKSNQQPQGILSYDEVTSFLIAYFDKYGKL